MKIKALFGLLAGGVIAYSGLWYSMGLNIERQIVERMDNLREKGIRVEHSPPELTGFPYRMEITLRDISLNAQKFGWRGKAASATAIGHVWAPDHWFLRLRGTYATALNGALTLTSADNLSSIRWDENDTMQIGIDLSTMDTGGALFGSGGIKAEKAELHLLIPAAGEQSDRGLLSPLVFKGALRVAKASNGTKDYRSLDRGEMLFALHGKGLDSWSKEALENWRDAGGTFEITGLSMSWGPSDLDGNASLSLDEELRPIGAATVTLKNAEMLLKNLKKLGLLTDQPSQKSGTLTLMAQSGELTANGKHIAKLKSIKP